LSGVIKNWLISYFAIASLIIYCWAIYPLFIIGEGGFELFPSSFMQAIFFLIYFISTIFILLKVKLNGINYKGNFHFWTFMLFIIFSVFWADYIGSSFRGLLSFIGSTIFGIFLSYFFNKKEFLRILLIAFIIISVSSYFTSIMLPSFGIHHDIEYLTGDWKGVFTHKNILGRIMALAILTASIYFLEIKSHKIIILTTIILFTGLIVFSSSISSLVILLVVFLFIALSKLVKYNIHLVLSLTAFLILIMGVSGAILYSNFEHIMLILGRDPTLTGRTVLWGYIFDFISEKPFFGYGYQSFWLGYDGINSRTIYEIFNYEFSHAHNGYLDILLQIGVIGFVLFLFQLYSSFNRVIKNLRYQNNRIDLFILGYLIYFCTLNISESNFLEPNSIYWVIYVYIVFSLNKNNEKTREEQL